MRALLLGMPNAIWVWHLYQVFPNLGLTSLAGNVDDDFEVDVADLIVVRRNFKSFLETRISRHAPDIIGLSAMSLHAKTARYIARFVKQIDPEIKVVLGGYHVTTMTEEIGRSSWGSDLDFMIRGEAELGDVTLPEVALARLEECHVDPVAAGGPGHGYHRGGEGARIRDDLVYR